jgi:ribosomal protein S18 acetylase RimI-like enzyme
MIFETLYGSATKEELILVEGGLCHWHLRKDGQLTIREIIVLPEYQRQGIGTAMLEELKTKGATSIFAKCPVDLISGNAWYEKHGFTLEGIEKTRTGRKINLWRLWK